MGAEGPWQSVLLPLWMSTSYDHRLLGTTVSQDLVWRKRGQQATPMLVVAFPQQGSADTQGQQVSAWG